MSGKLAKQARKALRGYNLPPHPTENMNHARRIGLLVKQEGITVEEAVLRYTIKVGLVPKPKLSLEELKDKAAVKLSQLR